MLCGCGMAIKWPRLRVCRKSNKEGDKTLSISEELSQYYMTENKIKKYLFDSAKIIDELRNRRSKTLSSETLRTKDFSHCNFTEKAAE